MSTDVDSVIKSAHTLMVAAFNAIAERDRLKAANAELTIALKLAEFAMDDCPMVSQHLSNSITTARAALTKHKESQA